MHIILLSILLEVNYLDTINTLRLFNADVVECVDMKKINFITMEKV